MPLELAVIRLALECQGRLPEGRYLALNVSPAVLEHDDLAFEIAAHRTNRPLVVEITEHQPVEDYVALSASLDRLRDLGRARGGRRRRAAASPPSATSRA